MSKVRRVKVSKDRLVRGPNGRFLCRWCKTEVKPPRRTFCSDACVHEWRLRSDAQYIRKLVFERDGGVCALCGLDTTAVDRTLRQLRFQVQQEVSGRYYPWNSFLDDACYLAKCEELGVTKHLRKLKRTFWEADHIIPVCEDGGGCDLTNYRTLCWKCHSEVTKELNRRRKTKA